ncbi:MAG TPA: hydrolase 1, exosortase A system-associated [Thiobacillaceae bacterium]|nr:hydrolase 1, exosortase A system-associated [Thiobacillaceae bacterium]
MNYREIPLLIPCQGDRMLGILSRPDGEQKGDGRIGVLIIVGGPQYRAGSHRQFTLLARHLAAHGIPAMRFDYRGMGDSEGEMRTFEEIDDDIRAALDAFFDSVPGMGHAVLWGLCDAATAALFYAPTDRRVAGLILLNPWVHTESAAAKVLLRHYYLGRLSSRTFWQKVFQGRVNVLRSLRSLAGLMFRAAGKGDHYRRQLPRLAPNSTSTLATACGYTSNRGSPSSTQYKMASTNPDETQALPARLLTVFRSFRGQLLIVLSGRDYVAREYRELVENDLAWKRALTDRRTPQVFLADADHVFSRKEWRDRVAFEVENWVSKI